MVAPVALPHLTAQIEARVGGGHFYFFVSGMDTFH
jgi:hypothetical protein